VRLLNSVRIPGRTAGVAIAAGLIAAQSATGQAVTVRGVAFDSLHGKPLANAFVSMSGDARTTSTDARGRFSFDGVAPGPYTFTMQHVSLDSLGFSGLSTRATVTDGRAEVRIAVPSFATLWRVTCGTDKVPKDSGFVYGTIRNATTGEPATNASVELTWLELGVDKSRRIRQRWWRGEARADDRGGYAVCGVPVDVGLRLRAGIDSTASGLIDLPAVGVRVQRRDLFIGPASDSSASHRGMVVGRVTGTGGAPVADARVIVDGVPEIRSGADGAFRVRDVPSGTRQVEILAIGMMPSIAIVDVIPNDSTRVTAELRKVTTLDVVRVTAPMVRRRMIEDFDERRRRGAGYMFDSTVIANRGTLSSLFFELPSARVERTGKFNDFFISLPAMVGRCIANLWIDGSQQRGFADDPASIFDQLNALRPGDLAAVEVYPRSMSVPTQFTGRNPDCGAVLVWTKWAFR
jgi:hypothetical protein